MPLHRPVWSQAGSGLVGGLSPDQVDDAIHLYNLGWSLACVGEHLNVDHTTALTKLRERGLGQTE
jgi:hypothetical protein